MRIRQYADTFSQIQKLAASTAQPTKPERSVDKTGTAIRDALSARQADLAKGYTQASRERDATKDSAAALGQAKEAVAKLQDEQLNAEDREKFRKQFTEAMAAVGKAGEAQTTAKQDPKLANATYDTRRTGSVAADQVGRRASERYGSAAEVAKVDPAKASQAELAEAGKVLEKAQGEALKQNANAQRQVDRISGRVRDTEAARAQIAGETKPETRQDRNLAAMQAFLQEQRPQATGGLVNFLG